MKNSIVIIAGLLAGMNFHSFGQNDLDAIRYSRPSVNGTSRFTSMGGAFAALGADLSCATTNPAGLGIFTKAEIAIGGGLRFTHHQGSVYGNSSTISNANFAFNNFGAAINWKSKSDPEQRHLLSYTNTQLQNFNNRFRMSGYTNQYSIAGDMLEMARNKQIDDLNPAYEKAGYETYVLDVDTNARQYFSFVDLKRNVMQTRDVVTSGRMNEANFSYAYSFKDQIYFGLSVGLPKVSYTSTTTHSEVDDKDSMRVTFTSTQTFTSTYSSPLPQAYSDLLGFHSLTYTEYFSTSGNGVNVKAGIVYRAADFLRIGLYAHSPSIFSLKDVYYYEMKAAFDANKTNPLVNRYPGQELATYDYKITTPAKLGASIGIIIKKYAAIGLDYEYVNYKTASISGQQVSDFAGVNAVIKNKYKGGHNFKVGGEVNIKPIMLRAGYVMLGSPFGKIFAGDFVRHTVSFGLGYRTSKNFFYDFCWSKNLSKEDYYMFATNNLRSSVRYNSSILSATFGIKF